MKYTPFLTCNKVFAEIFCVMPPFYNVASIKVSKVMNNFETCLLRMDLELKQKPNNNLKHKEDIILELEDEILDRYTLIQSLTAEITTLELSIRTLKGENITHNNTLVDVKTVTSESYKKEIVVSNYPNYPFNGTLLEKYRYLEDIELRFWKKRDYDAIIEKIEGPNASLTILKSKKELPKLISNGFIISFKYSGLNSLTFYSTRKSWVDIQPDGKHLIVEGREPILNETKQYSAIATSPDLIKWIGI